MAACKFTSTLTIKKTDLPVTCKLQNPPKGVKIAAATLSNKAGTQIDLKVSKDGQSFVIPAKSEAGVEVTAGVWTLGVGVENWTDIMPAIDVVEVCDDSQWILTIVDHTENGAITRVTVT